MNKFIALIFTTLIILNSCAPTNDQPVLSGILWGGEGNRLIIRSVSASNEIPDTILIDNKSEFVWNPENVVPGMYYLENDIGKKILLILNSNKPQIVDGQYVTFPHHLKTYGTDLPQLFLKVETLCEEWNFEIENAVANANESRKNVALYNIKDIDNKLDSIKMEYRKKALLISDDPLVKMVVLLQYVGNIPLFDTWKDRNLFFEIETELNPYKEINEVKIFSEKISKLHEMEKFYNKISVGDKFPLLIFDNDTISTEKYTGKIVYIEIRKSNTSHETIDLSSFKNSKLETFILTLEEKEEEEQIINSLGIMQFPSNFLLNTEGLIAAKNIWDNELKGAIGELIK